MRESNLRKLTGEASWKKESEKTTKPRPKRSEEEETITIGVDTIVVYNGIVRHIGDRVWDYKQLKWCTIDKIIDKETCVVKYDDSTTQTIKGLDLAPNPQS